jgi:hypothetical protein
MGCERFEVGIRDAKTGKMMNRTWIAGEVHKSIPWLKRMNAKGNDIYVRPADDKTGLILVDDIDAVTVAEMRENGHAPALVVETSSKNMQAWVNTSHRLTQAYRTAIARHLAKTYDADRASADGKHYGRLAGFTNQKPKHEDKYGRHPFCLLRQSPGQKAAKASELVQKAHINLLEKEKAGRINQIKGHRPGFGVVNAYKEQMQLLHQRYGPDIDWSRADWMVAKDLAKRGYGAQDIKRAIHEASPGLFDRKRGHFEDYIDRTVGKVFDDPDVKKSIERRKSQSKGMSP